SSSRCRTRAKQPAMSKTASALEPAAATATSTEGDTPGGGLVTASFAPLCSGASPHPSSADFSPPGLKGFAVRAAIRILLAIAFESTSRTDRAWFSQCNLDRGLLPRQFRAAWTLL